MSKENRTSIRTVFTGLSYGQFLASYEHFANTIATDFGSQASSSIAAYRTKRQTISEDKVVSMEELAKVKAANSDNTLLNVEHTDGIKDVKEIEGLIPKSTFKKADCVEVTIEGAGHKKAVATFSRRKNVLKFW